MIKWLLEDEFFPLEPILSQEDMMCQVDAKVKKVEVKEVNNEIIENAFEDLVLEYEVSSIKFFY